MCDINPIKKDANDIIRHLANNFQEHLYHFTNKENIKYIKELGGLYSWVQLEQMGRPCPYPGGTALSRNLDKKYGVADYVHLSFTAEHPMSYNKENTVILLIHPIVCLIPDTLFCNMNATDVNHSIGPNLEDLEKIDFGATKRSYLNSDSKLFKSKQAEVLVKGYIPSKYIINLEYVD